ncbi:hypothetical protein CALVIDRAFT_181908 [Calocera viscosa TUFC12733]|uniref:Uncharacterized protein n=1 Tax=Calocera viscosa (strain TUFC12733) TaxID=1330018 RepID=A0A167L0T5_CALVF|nr:hypothetical protein CALVIDRAFT_181908 [Calocera viscosa TUFC12733]
MRLDANRSHQQKPSQSPLMLPQCHFHLPCLRNAHHTHSNSMTRAATRTRPHINRVLARAFLSLFPFIPKTISHCRTPTLHPACFQIATTAACTFDCLPPLHRRNSATLTRSSQ